MTLGGLLLGLPGCSSEANRETRDEGTDEGAASSADSFLARYDALASELGTDVPALLAARGALIKDWLSTRYDALFSELRQSRPILHTGGPVPTLVSQHGHVIEVLDKNDVFAVIPYQRETTATIGRFSLADTDLARHDLEKGAMREVLAPLTDDAFRARVRAEAESLVGAAVARAGGKLDVVRDLARILPVRVVSRVFGVASGIDAAPGGPTDATMYAWIARTFQNFFLNMSAEPTVQAAGRGATQELLSYVSGLVRARRAQLQGAQTGADDVLGRFLALQASQPEMFSDERIATNLVGIVTGAVVTVEKALANVVDVILDPRWGSDVLDGARTAATRRDARALHAYATEALRFRPQGIAIPRLVTADTALGGVALPAKTLVLASHPSAMRTPEVFSRPDEFLVDPKLRPEAAYLHFGYRRYECLGKAFAEVELAEALGAVLRLPDVRRGVGELVYEGPYPDTFVVETGRR